jgi:hypothetical protein
MTKYTEILLGREDRPLAPVRKASGSYARFLLSHRRAAFDSDAGKRILTRRKNEDQEGPRRGVDESDAEVPETAPAICRWKIRHKSPDRRANRFELKHSRCRGRDHGTGSSLDCCISAGDAARQIFVALRGSRSSSVLKSYRRLNRHGRLRGAHAGPPSLPAQFAERSITASTPPMAQIPRFGLCSQGIPG